MCAAVWRRIGPVRCQLPQPPAADQLFDLRGPGVPGEEHGGARRGRPQGEHRAGVRVRRAWLGEQIVAVVVQTHQSEIRQRGEGAGPIADHHPDVAAQRPQESAVAGRRSRFGGQDHEAGRPEDRPTGPFEPVEVVLIGYDQHGPPAGVRRRARRQGQTPGPVPARVVTRNQLPVRARTLPGGEGPQQLGTVRVGRERAAPVQLGTRLDRTVRPGRSPFGPFGGRVPRWHGQPEHIGEAARVVVGDLADQRRDLGGQHRFGRDHLVQRRQGAAVVAACTALEDEPVPQLARRSAPGPGRPEPPRRPGRPLTA